MFKHYLTTALRHFRQHKLTTSINVVCLTIGLVCFLAIYAGITYSNSGDRHYPNSDRTYMINWQMKDSPVAAFGPWLLAKYLKTDIPELKTIARATFDSGFESEIPISAGDRKSFVHVSYADADFLEVFALPFLSGDSKNALRAPRSAVITKETAIQFFGGVSNAAGKQLRLQDGREITVRGVIDAVKQPSQLKTSGENSLGMVRFDVLLSMDIFEEDAQTGPVKKSLMTDWYAWFFFTYVVLPEDGSLTIEALRDRLKKFGLEHASSDGMVFQVGAWKLNDYWLSSMGAITGTSKTGIPATLMFYFLGAVVLLTSCLNYANLATAQAATRAKEIGMRRVVGARRQQIVAQFILEAALLALAALLCALAIIAVVIVGGQIPGAAAVVTTVIATGKFWAMLLSLLAAVTFLAGLYPAFVLSSVRPLQAVRAGKIRSGGRWISQLFVGLQFAGASFLLTCMLVMTAQNREFKRLALATSADALVTVANNMYATKVSYEVLRAELLRQPHIEDVTASAVSPWSIMTPASRVSTSSDVAASTVAPTQMNVNYDFFSTLKIRLLAGRTFDRNHSGDAVSAGSASPQRSIVIDQALAQSNGWATPNDALGKTLYMTEMGQPLSTKTPGIVVGVVENRPMSVMNPTGNSSNMYWLTPETASSPIVRIAGSDPAAGLREIESVWQKLAPQVALKMRFADEALNRTFVAFEGVTAVFSGVASLALFISVLGLIGMSMHVVGRRRHEIGVRKTLGASVQNIVRLLLLDFSKPVIVANILAWPMAFVAMQLYLSIFTQRTTLSPTPFIAGLVITVFIAWSAVIAQATRAARANPASVLRTE